MRKNTDQLKSYTMQMYKGYCIEFVKGFWKIVGSIALPFVSLEGAKAYIDSLIIKYKS
ncbi:hypothetical protein ABDK00_016995 [Niabella insulamsoli]|uniref:hypothetical protein n=1 Tax=Niabella insulamsoli TaxID=3144874 RepID=UPI0031FDEA80